MDETSSGLSGKKVLEYCPPQMLPFVSVAFSQSTETYTVGEVNVFVPKIMVFGWPGMVGAAVINLLLGSQGSPTASIGQ